MPFTLRSVGGSRFGGGGVHGETQGKEDKVCGVWGNEGKIYICTNENNRLLVTDTVPRSRWAEKYDIIIDSTAAHIIAVFQNPRCPYEIYVVYNNSITDCIEHSPSKNQWIKKHSFQLSNAKGAEILSIAFHQHTSMFFWCEKRGTGLGLTSYCVCLREVPENWDEEFMVNIGPVVAMLQCCPVMSLFIINKGVCMVPQLPNEEKQLLFFWTFVPRSLKVYTWNGTTVNSLDKTDFRSILMHILPVWNTAGKSDYIISLTTHPTTLELLLLDNTFTLSYACIQDGELCIQEISKLNLQCDVKTVRNIFAFGLFIGLVFESGILNIFDSRSGIALCTMKDLEGLSLSGWVYAGTVPSIGIWAAEGIWELKSTSISNVSKVLQSSFHLNHQSLQDGSKDGGAKSITEEENLSRRAIITCDKCFPEYIHHEIDSTCVCHKNISGPEAATQFLKTWNMHPAAAKVALSTTALKMSCSDTENFQEVGKEHLELLLGKTFQSPVASLTLFYQHPHYKGQILLCLKSFLQNWDQKADTDQSSSQTLLNELLYHHIKDFVTLTDKCEEMITTPRSLHELQSDLASHRDEIDHLFSKLNLSNPDSHSLSRLTYLQTVQSKSENEVCKSMGQTMGLKFEGSSASQEVKISSQRLRRIFRIEWKDGHWQRNRTSFENSTNPSLGLLCSLLYNEEPDWLLKVYESGLGLVHAKDTDEKAKDHVTQSMLDCLPSLIVDTSPKSTYAHALLLWTSGQELQAMQVILRHQMWCQALDFFSSFTEHTNFSSALFSMMVKAFVRCKAPKEVLLKALSLVPPGFSTYELLFLLQQNGPRFGQPFVDDNQVLRVGDVREQLKNMFTL